MAYVEFSHEEKLKLIENAETIRNWIVNSCSDIREPIEIELGDIVSRGRFDERREHEYTLLIKRSGDVVSTNIKIDKRNMEDVAACGNDYKFYFELCKNWKDIKFQILGILEREKAMTGIINDFQI